MEEKAVKHPNANLFLVKGGR